MPRRCVPDIADALNNLGNVHKELGDFAPAKAAFDAALAARPSTSPPSTTRAA